MQATQFFATTAKGLEELLAAELKGFNAENVKVQRAGVLFEGSIENAYRACLWSRIANHILLPLSNFEAEKPEDLYIEIQNIDWLKHMQPEATLRIDVKGKHQTINNTQFIAQKAKDAIVDQIREKAGIRPSIESVQPDIVINIFVNRNKFNISLSLSGDSLHRRGYRVHGGKAPLKENLAAGILMRAGWPELINTNKANLIDPMCGSGTLLIEAVLMAYDIAPGLNSEYFGFSRWLQHDKEVWEKLITEARSRCKEKLSSPFTNIVGFDKDPRIAQKCQENIEQAGLEDFIDIKQKDARQISKSDFNAKNGLVLFNPPYGERLEKNEEEYLKSLFKEVGNKLKSEFSGFELAVFIGNPELAKSFGIRSYKQYKMFNGTIAASLLKFHLSEEYFMKFETAEQKLERQFKNFAIAPSEQQIMFENRLKKNLKHLRKWAKREGISCYRVYDADLPEYAVAIDIYEDNVHIQEYQAGKNVDKYKSQNRLREIHFTIHKVLEIPLEQIFIKTRQRQKGKEQYEVHDSQRVFDVVSEGRAKFFVNFTDYLDTGLFLDHRIMRQKVAESAKDKTVLNLFAYTCTASVHAAMSRAKSVTSVDMSNTYLDWGKKNFKLNKIRTSHHDFIKADCFKWLDQTEDKFDVIFLDPPTFSNSKSMENTLDIQRDHVDLIRKAMNHLNDDGTLFFSTNFRKFKLDKEKLDYFKCENISKQCLPEDFKRRPNIHQCWQIKMK